MIPARKPISTAAQELTNAQGAVIATKPASIPLHIIVTSGLVAITAPCAFVSSWAAVLIGFLAGIIVVYSALFFEHKMKIDDPVGAISVHGVCGAFGVLTLGLFANGQYGDALNGVPGTVKGLFYGDPSQFMAEVVGVITNPVSYTHLR